MSGERNKKVKKKLSAIESSNRKMALREREEILAREPLKAFPLTPEEIEELKKQGIL